MSLAPEYFFSSVTGNDQNDGLSDAKAKQTYGHLLSLVNTALAGTIFNAADSCVFNQTVGFRINNPNAVTEISSISFDGTHVVCKTPKPSNVTVGQLTTLKGTTEPLVNGIQIITDVLDELTFKFIPDKPIINPIGIDTQWHDKIRFDGGMIKIRRYVSSQFAATVKIRPVVEYSDQTTEQHGIDGNAAVQGIEWAGINFKYTGAKPASGVPNCFFIYNEDKESIYLKNLNIDGYRIGLYVNHKAANSIRDIVVDNCVIINNWSQGILGHPDYSLIRNTLFKNNGHNITGGSRRLHNLYLSTFHNTKITGCYFTESAMADSITQGVEFVVHGVCADIEISYNHFENAPGVSGGGGYAIAIDSGYNTPEKFTNFTVQRNTIIDCGNKSIELNAWEGGLIEENTIINNGSFNHTGIRFSAERKTVGTPTTDGVTIRGNYITGTGIQTDIDTSVGTNFDVTRTDVPVPPETTEPPIEPPPTNPDCPPPVIEVVTTVEIKVDGVVTKSSSTTTTG